MKEVSQPTPPSWMTQLPQEDTFLYFVGSHTGADNLEQGQSAARKDAMAKIAEYLGVDVASQLDMTITDVEQSVKEELQAKTDAIVKQALIADSYHEKTTRTAEKSRMVTFDVHLLVKYPKEQAQKELGRKESEAQHNAQAAYDLYQAGLGHQKQGDHQQAKRLFQDALDLLALYSTVIPLDKREIQNSQELISRLESEKQKTITNLRRLVVWTWETNPDGDPPSSNMSSHIQGVAQQHSFSIVEFPFPKDKKMEGILDAAKWQEDPNIFPVLKSKGVQYLIVAQAKSEYSSTKMKNHFYKASGFLKVFNTATGEAIMTLPINSRGYDRTKSQAGLQALEEAGTIVGKILVQELLAREDS